MQECFRKSQRPELFPRWNTSDTAEHFRQCPETPGGKSNPSNRIVNRQRQRKPARVRTRPRDARSFRHSKGVTKNHSVFGLLSLRVLALKMPSALPLRRFSRPKGAEFESFLASRHVNQDRDNHVTAAVEFSIDVK
jgi:hypothetical protein